MDNPGRVQERQKHKALTSQLKEHQGGPLGVQYVKVVEIGYTDPEDAEAWQTLLAPYRQISPKQWQLSEGPAIRLLKSDIKEIKSVVFIVTSLEAAVQYLKAQDLLGPVDKTRAHLKTPEDWEFKIILQE